MSRKSHPHRHGTNPAGLTTRRPDPVGASDRSPVVLPMNAAETVSASAARGAMNDEIRSLAYAKWEAAGGPPGDGVGFWLDAERELR